MSERSLVRADLLQALENAGAVTQTELRLSADVSLEQYEALGVMLGQFRSSLQWWIGDWLVFGEERFGPLAAQLSEALNLSPEGRQEYLRVALAIPPSRRRPGLTWSHHRRVAARWITPEQRERLLDLAEAERLTSHELQAHVESLRERLAKDIAEVEVAGEADVRPNLSDPGAGSRSRPASACEALVDETLAQLRADLLDCGFPDDLTVTVEISAGNVAYRASVGGEAL